MAESESTDTAHAPINLGANSYDFQALEKASLHAESLKTDDGRAEAFGRIVVDNALNRQLVDAQIAGATPEGTTLAKVEDAQGREVVAAVYFADERQARAAAETLRDNPPAAEQDPVDPPSDPVVSDPPSDDTGSTTKTSRRGSSAAS